MVGLNLIDQKGRVKKRIEVGQKKQKVRDSSTPKNK